MYNIDDINDIEKENDNSNENENMSSNVIYPRVKYVFPYKKESDVKKALNGNLFNILKKGNQVKGYVIRKTLLQDVPNYIQKEKRYLIKNDLFIVKDVSSKWLNVEYSNGNKKVIGWVQCEDTSICQ